MDSSTQDFLQIGDIREDVLVLKNKDLRGILMVSSINFALQAQEEQSAIINTFQDFLNSLDFSCQIIVQSRNINITNYLDIIKSLEEKQSSELLKIQTSSYVEFIKDLVKEGLIMTKNFYVIVPYSLAEGVGTAGAVKEQFNLSKLFGAKNDQPQTLINDEDFAKCRNQLWQRMEFVATGLKRCRLEVALLSTPEIIELFWAAYHPAEAEVGYHPEIMPELLR